MKTEYCHLSEKLVLESEKNPENPSFLAIDSITDTHTTPASPRISHTDRRDKLQNVRSTTTTNDGRIMNCESAIVMCAWGHEISDGVSLREDYDKLLLLWQL